MFKHSTGWDINARILRLRTQFRIHPSNDEKTAEYLEQVVREIARDTGLVWC